MPRERAKPIDSYTLGLGGVILDPHPLMPGVQEDALVQAQNVTHDPTLGRGGALRKRPGFGKFNQINAGGAILGGIPMALAGTGGAPTDGGGGDTGGGDGGGDGTGSGGGDGGDGGGGTGGSGGGTGGGAFGASNPAIVVGFDTNNSADGYGWYITTPKIASAATIGTIPYAPGAPASTGYDVMHGRPYAYSADGWLYFMQALTDTTGGASINIYRTNGTVTQLASTIAPYDSGNNKRPVVTAMAFADSISKCYVAIRDTSYNVTTSPDPQCRVFEIDHTTLVTTQVFRDTIYTIPAMWWVPETSRLYCSMALKYNASAPVAGINPVVWAPAQGYGDTPTGIGNGTWTTKPFMKGFAVYNGCLYVGILTDSSAADFSADSPLMGKPLDNAWLTGIREIANSGAYITNGAMATILGETQGANAGVYNCAAFKGSLFASYYNPGTRSCIVKCTSDATAAPLFSAGNVTLGWTDSGISDRVPHELFEFGGVLYAIGTTGGGGTHHAMYTDDGVTWNNVTSNLFAANPASGFPIGVLWGIDKG